MILAARRVEALKSVAEACAAAHKESGLQQGGKFATVPLDVSDKKQIATFLEKVPEELRKVDILGSYFNGDLRRDFLAECTATVNNAGFVLGVEKVGDISDADIEAMFSVNVFGLIAVTQLFIKGRWADSHATRRCSDECSTPI